MAVHRNKATNFQHPITMKKIQFFANKLLGVRWEKVISNMVLWNNSKQQKIEGKLGGGLGIGKLG